MKTTIGFGKIDYNKSGRKNCRVTIDIELTDGRLRICGNIWNPRETDCYSCGQNIDTIADLLPSNKQVQRIKAIWERWHLNDLKAGSPAQETYIREHPVKAVYPVSYYDEACKALACVGLNPDPSYIHKGKPYAYGSAWLTEEIPGEVIAEVQSWQAVTNVR